MNKKDYTTISDITLLIFGILAIILAAYFISQKDLSDFNFQSQTEDSEQKEGRKNFKVETFVIKFLKAHPDWLNNDLATKEANKDFESEAINQIKDPNFLEDVPMKLVDVSDRWNKYTATFVTLNSYDGFYYNHPIDEISYEVIGEISKETAMKLKQDDTYFIKFKFIKILTDSERENLMSEGRVRGKKRLKDYMSPLALPIVISAGSVLEYQNNPDHIYVSLGTLLGKFIYIH